MIVGRASTEAVDALRRARDAAATSGRSEMVDEARAAARRYVSRVFAEQGFSGTWALTEMAMSVTRPADRVAVAEALADAVTADAVEDLIDRETADALRATWATLSTVGPLPEPGSLSGLGSALTASGGRVRTSLAMAVLLLSVGVIALLNANMSGVVFLIAGVSVLRNALRGRGA